MTPSIEFVWRNSNAHKKHVSEFEKAVNTSLRQSHGKLRTALGASTRDVVIHSHSCRSTL